MVPCHGYGPGIFHICDRTNIANVGWTRCSQQSHLSDACRVNINLVCITRPFNKPKMEIEIKIRLFSEADMAKLELALASSVIRTEDQDNVFFDGVNKEL